MCWLNIGSCLLMSLPNPVACSFTPQGEPMRIIYRMRGLLGDATEEFIESLDSTTGTPLASLEVKATFGRLGRSSISLAKESD